MSNLKDTEVVTGKCRLSYEHIWEAKAPQEGADPQWSASIIIPSDDEATLEKIRSAIQVAIKEGVTTKWHGKTPRGLKLPLRSGDERPDDEAYDGCYFVNANNKKRQPKILNLSGQEITDPEQVYSGCYCRFLLSFYPFSASGNNGIACSLEGVQFVRDGEPLGGRGTDAASAFDDGYEGDGEGEDWMN